MKGGIKMKWHHVNNELPEYGEWVLIFEPTETYGRVIMGYRSFTDRGGEAWKYSGGDGLIRGINYWQPLPEPPKDLK